MLQNSLKNFLYIWFIGSFLTNCRCSSVSEDPSIMKPHRENDYLRVQLFATVQSWNWTDELITFSLSKLCTFCLRMRLHVLACIITFYIKGKALMLTIDSPSHVPGANLSCCSNKLVGDIHYTLLGENPEIAEPLQCLDSCIYERPDAPGTKYCFTSGSLPTFCTDSPAPTTTSSTSQGKGTAVFRWTHQKWCWEKITMISYSSSYSNPIYISGENHSGKYIYIFIYRAVRCYKYAEVCYLSSILAGGLNTFRVRHVRQSGYFTSISCILQFRRRY